ncbi:hypothetical protein DEDE109153_15225 [Deinococcus deserti]|uniref:Uncharacterized protein n=1 Tax=Deinococcus deserti (strain DSM 17065 / CIP 109153 / LMG 22923 / VCD115) TaxID=546414 RepID=X5HLJ4_DEIDV|nr:hypothetical protein Deide_1p00514 [Deinococcus deserti VCD115]
MTASVSVTCSWVPGTLDRIRVTCAQHDEVWHIRDVANRYGREALNALYLKGRYQTHVSRRELLAFPFIARTEPKS